MRHRPCIRSAPERPGGRRPGRPGPDRRVRVLPGLALLGATLAMACGGAPEEVGTPTIPREAFVATYVDLRLATLRVGGPPETARKNAILEEHGVTDEELVRFVEVHGREAAFMREVWDEVEERLNTARLMSRGEETGSDSRDEGGGAGS